MSDVIRLSRPCIPPPVVLPKAPFSVLMYTTLIFSLSLNHSLYAENSQLFLGDRL